MSRAPSNDPDDDFAVEITSLDGPETPIQTPNSLLQEPHLTPRVRTWLTILSVAGALSSSIVSAGKENEYASNVPFTSCADSGSDCAK